MKELLTLTQMPITELVTDPENARLHPDKNLDAICGSLELFGQREPLVVQRGTNRVIGGNGRLAAMRTLGWTEATVTFVDCSDAEATALGLALNRTAETASWDTERLDELIERCRTDGYDTEAFGFDAKALSQIIARAERDAAADAPVEVEHVPDKEAPSDDIPDLPKESRVAPGDLWLLGNHRLFCGDSSDHSHVLGLMGGHKADMVFTDPPYNCGGQNTLVASGARKSYADLKGTAWDQDFNFADVEQNMLSVMAESCSVYVCTSHHLFGGIIEWMTSWADHHQYCVWAKSNPMPSLQKRHYTWNTELVAYATRGKHTFNFPDEGHTLSTWNLAKNIKNDMHPTMKPVAVPAHAIQHSSNQGDIVTDFYGGAGSTLLACDQLGRRAYVMEVDPRHCGTILKRWEEYTGQTAIRHDGED